MRVKATEDTPASKIVKISVAGQQKAPNLKIDYKKEIVKGKANASITCNGIFLAKDMTKDSAKNASELADYLNSSASAELKVWICATAKKPASAVQTINAAKRFDASSLTLSDVVTYDPAK
ncbi:MAG: hypothetical protein J6U10_01615, partial [Lachnospiraceae bacterium]|nr:hypothetical protein [Lachnospiraceae bacterium]